jgi:hypothetical protein
MVSKALASGSTLTWRAEVKPGSVYGGDGGKGKLNMAWQRVPRV